MSTADLRGDLQSGDPGRQTSALLGVLGMLASGRDVGPLVSLACSAVLAAPNSAPEPKRLAYDVAATATLSDTDWARVAVGIRNDLGKEAGRETRARALRVLPMLPPHRLTGLLADVALMERLVISLRSTSDAVRAAAIDCCAELAAGTSHSHLLSLAAESPGLLGGLIDAWEAITDGLTDESDVVCAAACCALAALLRQTRVDGAGGGSLVMQNLVQAVHVRGASVLALALARFRVLNTVLLTHVPPLLLEIVRSQRPPLGRRDLHALPGELPPPDAAAGTAGEGAGAATRGAAGAHFYDEAASLLVELLGAPAQPVMLAAAEALLQLAEGDSASAAVQAALPRAIQSLLEAVAPQAPASAATLPQVLPMLLSHLGVLPPAHQVALFHRLLPLVAALPSATDRTKALSTLWMAVLRYDWGGKAVRRNANSPPELQQLLSDPHVKEVVSGVATRDEGLGKTASGLDPRLVYPAFREELAGTLLHLLLTHNRGSSLLAGSAVAGASSAISEAVALQGLLESADWLSSAKTALQGTKACLGWDRGGASAQQAPVTTGTTAVVDLWLQLLLGALQVCRSLKAAAAARTEAWAPAVPAPAAASPQGALENGTAGPVPGVEGPAGVAGGGAKEAEPRPVDLMLAALLRRLGTIEMDMQGMLLQIATNWRALHPVVRPRAVWVCAVHLRFKSTLDSGWNGILDAVRGLLAEARKAEAANYLPAVAEGVLAARKEAPGAPSRAAAGAAAATQNAEVALLCLERLVLLLAHNNRRELADQLGPIGALLKKIIEVEADKEGAPASKERLARLLDVVGPVASGGKKKEGQGARKGNKENEAGGQENGVVVVDLIPDPAQPLSAAYPLTLPSAAALFATLEAKRYRNFLSQLQSAGGAAAGGEQWGTADLDSASAGAAGGNSREEAAALLAGVGGVPSLLELTSVLSAGAPEGGGTPATRGVQEEEVAGPAAPLALLLSHSVHPGSGSVTVHCRVQNRTLEEVRGVEVVFVPGGPLAPESRRPMSFRLEPLPPAESTAWDVRLDIAGFGGPVLQPSITLPVRLPDGEPQLRCKPYAISPLSLLAPPTSPVTPAEFYQRWQALPYRAQLSGAAVEGGLPGLQHVLGRLERTPMACVTKALSPVQGSVHAALHGRAWDGEVIACVITGALPPSTAGAAGSAGGGPAGARLHFFFRSDSAEVVAHVQGHEGELLDQLTGGLVAPAGGGEEDSAAGTAAGAQAAEQKEEAASRPGFMSFLRGVTTREEFGGDKKAGGQRAEGEGGDEGEGETDEVEAAAEQQRLVVERAVLTQWQRLRALLVGWSG